jgi:hypothetical protein
MTRRNITMLLVGCGLVLAWLQTGAGNEPKTKVAPPSQIFVIRHGEKELNDKTDPHLNARGNMRAAALPGLFVASPKASKKPTRYAKPDFLYAAAESKNSNRPVETILPLSRALGDMPIQRKTKEFQPAIDQIFSEAKHAGKVVLICWRHGPIADLAQAIAAKAKNADQLKKQIPAKWEAEVFDRVWRFSFDDAGNATFADEPQKLLVGDSMK